MKILGIESSCDETAAAVVKDGQVLMSNVVQSQVDIHAEYGGVVPEVAARSHIEVINPVIRQAMTQANVTWDDIDAIAVANAPGLIGSLLVGCLAAATLAKIHNKPLYPVHHVEGHIYANFLTSHGGAHPSALPRNESEATAPPPEARLSARTTPARVTSGGAAPNIVQPTDENVRGGPGGRTRESDLRRNSEGISDDGSGVEKLVLPNTQPTFPMLALAVSGLHSQLVLFEDHGKYRLLGETLDDAVGEAFDKVAKILGLPYPGGPSITAAALHGDPKKYQLPRARLDNPYSFSFSGLKTAVLRAVQREVGVDHTFPSFELSERLNNVQRADFSASFQHTAVKTLVDATEKAFHEFKPSSVVIAGGVAANTELRKQLRDRLPIDIEYAPIQLCTDNAAMIATLAYYQSQVVDPTDPDDLEVKPSLSMKDTAWAKG